LEVAEHLPHANARGFVRSLFSHGEIALFAAAPKGQGGTHHINEQSYDYWRKLFAGEGYEPIDYLRPRILKDRDIEPWYRYNTLLYVSQKALPRLPKVLRDCRVPTNQRIPDVSPLPYKLRKAFLRTLPVPVVTHLDRLHARRVVSRLAVE
jgi:hypothetical protein